MFASIHLVNDPMNPCLRISYYRYSEYGGPFVPKISIVSDKTQLSVLKYLSLMIKLNR